MDKGYPTDGASKAVYEWRDKLARKLKEHKTNIEKTTIMLRVEDFEYRALGFRRDGKLPPVDSIDEILRHFLEEVS